MVNFINLNLEKKEKVIFDKSGDYLIFFKNLSGSFTFDIVTPNVNVNIYGLYFGKNSDKFEIKTTQNHFSPNSTSHLLIKGVFYDEAFFNYDGLIKIEKNAQKSYAYQKNQNLLMSEKAKVISSPNLEILANDVFCTHGSTTGFLNEEELFYLKTRGISKKEGEKILVDGFINEIIVKIKEKIPDFQYEGF